MPETVGCDPSWLAELVGDVADDQPLLELKVERTGG
jgi:hypothetical protein